MALEYQDICLGKVGEVTKGELEAIAAEIKKEQTEQNQKIQSLSDTVSAGVDLTGYQTKTDENLQTQNKTVVGAINELHSREDKQGLTEEQVKEIVRKTAVTEESDPTVSEWAKQPQKPTYTYDEITEKPNYSSEIWTFTLEDGSTVTKKIVVLAG